LRDEDNTSYELAEFCKLATKGNATILEVFFSDKIISTTDIIDEMRANWLKFMNTRQFIDASRGYAHNQWNKFYNFESKGINEQEHTSKFAIAFLRVMWQCEQFLLTGQFVCNLKDSDLFPLLKKIKPLTVEEIQDYLPEIVSAMSDMNNRVSVATSKSEYLDLKPDISGLKTLYWRRIVVKIDLTELNKRVEQKLISVQKHPEADLYIYNYTPITQFKRHWDEYTLMSRGLILDGEGTVVARPFTKFFNYQEHTGEDGTVAKIAT
jgi:hypothetical protein